MNEKNNLFGGLCLKYVVLMCFVILFASLDVFAIIWQCLRFWDAFGGGFGELLFDGHHILVPVFVGSLLFVLEPFQSILERIRRSNCPLGAS